jgi:hypothetical protein
MNGIGWIDEHVKKMVDLRDCALGDILIGRYGSIQVYIKPTDEDCDYYDHMVGFLYTPGGSYLSTNCIGSRTHGGHVNKQGRWNTDDNVEEIIKMGTDKHTEMLTNEDFKMRHNIYITEYKL